MQDLGAAPWILAKVDILEDVEHLQGGVALAIGWELVDLVAAIVDVAGLDPFAVVRGEVGVAQIAADSLHVRVDGLRDRAGIERLAAAAGELLEGVGEIGVAEDLSGDRQLAIDQIGRAGVAELLDQARLDRKSVVEGKSVDVDG